MSGKRADAACGHSLLPRALAYGQADLAVVLQVASRLRALRDHAARLHLAREGVLDLPGRAEVRLERLLRRREALALDVRHHAVLERELRRHLQGPADLDLALGLPAAPDRARPAGEGGTLGGLRLQAHRPAVRELVRARLRAADARRRARDLPRAAPRPLDRQSLRPPLGVAERPLRGRSAGH